jgi:hypothetical protein
MYPDPTVCVCLYVGNAKAYSAYRKMMFERQLADEQQLTAGELNNFSWSWQTWSDGFPIGWPYTDPFYSF